MTRNTKKNNYEQSKHMKSFNLNINTTTKHEHEKKHYHKED
jgi:hypothetical protein